MVKSERQNFESIKEEVTHDIHETISMINSLFLFSSHRSQKAMGSQIQRAERKKKSCTARILYLSNNPSKIKWKLRHCKENKKLVCY